MPDMKQSSSKTGNKPKDDTQAKPEEAFEHAPTPEEEESLDRTLEDSFPASDPPSSIPDPDANAA